MARTVHKVHVPHAHTIYDGTGKTLDAAIIDAHKKIPPPRLGPSLDPQIMHPAAPKPGSADVLIRCKVVELEYEAGGIAGISLFRARVIED
jgi:hypothetical protein